jgi:acetyltransferase-like isoleucine patch superfamily enzyme
MRPFVHPSAIVEDGVEIGEGTRIWDNVHARGGSRIGAECIVGGKTYIAQDVRIGDRVKINAAVHLCAGVVVENGVLIGAKVVFTNDLHPRATTPDLRRLRPSAFGADNLGVRVREGASIGAASVILAGVEIGRFALIGMGSVVTRSVADFHLVRGNPARVAGAVCRCGAVITRFEAKTAADVACPACGLRYALDGRRVIELTPP